MKTVNPLSQASFSRVRIAALFLLAVAACGKTLGMSSQQLAQSCGLPQDQWDSLNPPMERSDVGVVWVHPDFTDSERTIIQRAVSHWNDYGMSVLGRPLLEMKVGSYPGLEVSSRLTSCQFQAGDDRSFAVLREVDSEKWASVGMTDSNPGVTVRCAAMGLLQRQVVLLNPSLVPEVQLGTVVVHELGHALGLDHSCSPDSTKSTYVSCSQIDSDHPYRKAVMYPSIRIPSHQVISESSRRVQPPAVVGTEIKEDLEQNDRDRAACLYRPR